LDVDREFCQQEKEKGAMIKHSRSRVWNRTKSLTFEYTNGSMSFSFLHLSAIHSASN
jgi:hypothetical protein